METYEFYQTPKPNFAEIANNAINDGIFRPLPLHSSTGSDTTSNHLFPHSLLATPYLIGGKDTNNNFNGTPKQPKSSCSDLIIETVNENLRSAQELLIPQNAFWQYFFHKTSTGTLFTDSYLRTMVLDYPHIYPPFGPDHLCPRESQLTSTRSKPYQPMNLYTPDESIEANSFAIKKPEAILTIFTLQNTIFDFLEELKTEFVKRHAAGDPSISIQNMYDYNEYMMQWQSSMFAAQIIPAFTHYSQLSEMISPDKASDKWAYSEALTFITNHKTFKEFFVNSEFMASIMVAIQNEVYTNMDTLQNALSLISNKNLSLYHTYREKLVAPNMVYTEDKTFSKALEIAVFRTLLENEDISFIMHNRKYRVHADFLRFHLQEQKIIGKKQPFDKQKKVSAGKNFANVLSEIMSETQKEDVLLPRVISFEIMGISYRVNPRLFKNLGSFLSYESLPK